MFIKPRQLKHFIFKFYYIQILEWRIYFLKSLKIYDDRINYISITGSINNIIKKCKI